MKLLLLVPISLAISACATPGPEPTQSESVQAVGSGGDELPVPGTPVETIQAIEESETPDVGENAVAMTGLATAEEGIICKREKPTGSHILVKVCRNRSEMLERERADQEMLRRGIRTGRIAVD